MYFRLIVLFAILTAVVSFTMRKTLEHRKLEPKPEKFEGVEGCYVRELDAVIPFGEYRYDHCEQYTCHLNHVEITSCVVVNHPEKY